MVLGTPSLETSRRNVIMMRKTLLEASAVLGVLILATWLISVISADVAISSWFCIDGHWPVGDQFFWQVFYKLDRTPAILLALFSLLLALYSLKNRSFITWRKQSVFLVILLIIGPGLVVNSYFKSHWGRPRPREILQFGGQKEFRQPWQKGDSGKGRSFPSGHAAAAFYMTAPFFIYRRSRPRLACAWLTGGLIFGVFMSIARITQGGHFISDCLWAFGVVYLVALLLAAVVRPDQDIPTETMPG